MNIKNDNFYLCSFASPDLEKSKKRFLSQAKNIGVYKKVKVFGMDDLSVSTRKQIENFFKNKKKRLFGYGCWKAEIIKNFLKKVPNNSIVQYTDVGCHLNINGLKRLKQYFNLCNKKGILTFQYKLPRQKKLKPFKNMKFQRYLEHEYTKMDLYKYLIKKNKTKIFNSEQIMSGIIFFKKNKFSIDLLNIWEKILKKDNLIDDSKSYLSNHKKFVEHRHDQSAFSLICKKIGVYSISSAECEWAERKNKRIWLHLKNFPIHARRDKKYNIFKRFINRQTKNFRRLIN